MIIGIIKVLCIYIYISMLGEKILYYDKILIALHPPISNVSALAINYKSMPAQLYEHCLALIFNNPSYILYGRKQISHLLYNCMSNVRSTIYYTILSL